ncbi:MAG TPA: SIS domain-containing protein [Anaerolineae bacterium]|nr:SIS domain-containing protein [Anaerolineae bacterium]
MSKSNILLHEIEEQPSVIRNLLDYEMENIRSITRSFQGKFKYILIAARGSSDNAARYAQYLFGAYNKIQVALATPSLFTLYKRPPSLNEALVIGISQSGQSPDIIEVLKEAKKQGRPTLCITNEFNSKLTKTADEVIKLHARKEKAIAATKTYTASLVALALISCCLDNDPKRLKQLMMVPSWISQTINSLKNLISLTQRYRYMEHCVVIGRGFNYATAFEIALKLKELTKVFCEPYSSADFLHGPIATIGKGVPVIIVAPGGKVKRDIENILIKLRTLGAETIIISNNTPLLLKGRFLLPFPKSADEWLSPIIAIVPGQLFARQLAIEKSLNPDNPIGLTKVTETY